MNLEEIRAKYTEEEIKKIKKNSRAMTIYMGSSLDEIVLSLEKLRRAGKLNCFVNFNGVKLYSIDVTMDSAYRQCLGCSRKTWLNRERKMLAEGKARLEKLRQAAQEQLPKWIEEGKKYIHPVKHEGWECICIASANGDYYGLEIKCALSIMKMLEEKVPFIDIKKMINGEGHSNMSYSKTMNIVLNYAKRGPAFYNFVNRYDMSKFDKKYVSKIMELNNRISYGESLSDIYKDLADYRMMDISIITDSSNIIKIANGTILVNADGTFEGILSKDNIISGKLLGENGIVFANFCNYKKASNYCGINEGGVFVGKHEIYSFDGNIDDGSVIILLKDVSNNFVSEIGLEYQIDKLKGYFDEYTSAIYQWYDDNRDYEADRILLSLRDGLEERLLDVLKLRLAMLNENNHFKVLAVPARRPFVIAASKRDAFLNCKTDHEVVRTASSMVGKLSDNLVDDTSLVRKRTSKDN